MSRGLERGVPHDSRDNATKDARKIANEILLNSHPKIAGGSWTKIRDPHSFASA